FRADIWLGCFWTRFSWLLFTLITIDPLVRKMSLTLELLLSSSSLSRVPLSPLRWGSTKLGLLIFCFCTNGDLKLDMGRLEDSFGGETRLCWLPLYRPLLPLNEE